MGNDKIESTKKKEKKKKMSVSSVFTQLNLVFTFVLVRVIGR